MRSQLATRHCHKGPVRTLDNLQIADYETMIEGNGAKRLETIATFSNKFDANLGDFHDLPPGDNPFGSIGPPYGKNIS